MKMAMLLLLALIPLTSGKKRISDVYLLLPQTLHTPNARLMQYSLYAYDGCYTWSTANNKIVAITQHSGYLRSDEDDSEEPQSSSGCSSSVTLEPVASVSNPPVVLVTAIDRQSGDQLKCEVKVDKIHKIEISTTVKSFKIDDFQRLFAVALDDEGNKFSSLEGLRFKWTIFSGMESLSISKFKDSLVKSSPSRLDVEVSNYQSDVILVEGKATGIANVTLKIEEPGYEYVPMAWTLISVSEPIAILPSTQVYLAPRSAIHFRLFKTYGNRSLNEIALPSSDYRWFTHSPLFNIFDNGDLYTKDSTGTGSVVVQDKQIQANSLECEVNVVAPDRIILTVEPYTPTRLTAKGEITAEAYNEAVNPRDIPKSNWNLISGNEYLINIRLYWRNSEIYIPDNAEFLITFLDERIWEVKETHPQGLSKVVVPRITASKQTATKVNARLVKFRARHEMTQDWIPPETIADSTEVLILRKVQILEKNPPIFLPYFAVLTTSFERRMAQEYHIPYEGGSSSLRWESSNEEIASVMHGGIVYAHRLGEVSITVTDALNPMNNDTVGVEVGLVETLKFEQERVEVVSSKEMRLKLIGLGFREQKFHNCSSILLDWHKKQKPEIAEILEKSPVLDSHRLNGVCEIRTIKASSEGHLVVFTELLHTPVFIGPTHPEIRLNSEEAKIGIFNPLSLSLQESYLIPTISTTETRIDSANAVVLAPGSSVYLKIKGGPLAWQDKLSAYKQLIETSSPLSPLIHSQRELQFQCPFSVRYPGEDYLVHLSVFNEQFEGLLVPGRSTLELSVGCYHPAILKLEWSNDLSGLRWKSMPTYFDQIKRTMSMRFHNDYWVVLNDQELMVNAIIYDEHFRKVFNGTSVEIDWSSENSLISFADPHTKSFSQKVIVANSKGPNTITAKLSRLENGAMLSKSVEASLNSEVVKNVELDPQEYSIYLHNRNSLEISINFGSGVFRVSCNSTDIVTHSYDGQRKIIVYPKSIGRVDVMVEDLGLPGAIPAYSRILVSNLAGLVLKEGGLIAINSTISLNLMSLDSYGQVFHPSQHSLMGVQLNFANPLAFNVVSVSSSQDQWIVRGVNIGEFHVFATGNKISNFESLQRSNSVIIDVFPPIQIIPPVVLLLPGSKYTLNYLGGPDPSKFISYGISLKWIIHDTKVASIDENSGLVTANQIGETEINLKMLIKGELLTEAFGTIKVRLVTGIGILGMGPGRSVLKDSATRLIAYCTHKDEKFSDAVSDITYTWKSNSPSIYSIYQEDSSDDRKVAVTGLALSAGKSDVTLHVKISYPIAYSNADSEFQAKITASVDNALISLPASHRCHSYLSYDCFSEYSRWADSYMFLVPPHAHFKLPFNKEAKVSVKCFDCREGFLKANEVGHIWSYGLIGETGLVVKSSEKKGDFDILGVAITYVESIHVDKSHLARTMSLGSEIELPITYQDSMARSFPSGFEYGLNVLLEVSNSRVLQATLENRNSTLKLRSQYVGDTIVKIYIADRPEVKDLIYVSVSSVMKPIAPLVLHIGGEAQFLTSHKSPAGVTGAWYVEKSNILRVSNEGKVKALQEGESYVNYREKTLDLRSLVKVHRIGSVKPSGGAPTAVTNFEKHPLFKSEVKIPLDLFIDKHMIHRLPVLPEDERKLVKHNIEIHCSTNTHSEWLLVESDFDRARKEGREDSEYACLISPLPSSSSSGSASRVLVIDIKISNPEQSYVLQSSFEVEFIPKFTLGGSENHIVLSGRNMMHSITVGSICSNLQVLGDSLIGITKLDDNGKCNLDLTVLSVEHDLRMKRIEILDTATGQKQEVFLSYYVDPAKNDKSFSLQDLLVVLALVTILFLVFYFYKDNNARPVQQRRPPQHHRPYGPLPQPRLAGETPAMRPAGPVSSPNSELARGVSYGNFK